MRKLLVLIACLLLAGPALGQGSRGLVDHMATGELPTCDDGYTGYRAYDTTLGYEVTCNGTAYVASGGTGNNASELATHDTIRICGDADTISTNTVYYGPDVTLTANTDGFACDINAAGNTTEATVDAPVFNAKAFDVVGMTCRQEQDSSALIIYTVRSAEADLTPSVTCVIDGTGAKTEQDCVADLQTTTQVAAGATVAISAASLAAVGANNGFICNISIVY